MEEKTLRAVFGALIESEEWKNTALLLGRMDSDQARAAIDTMDLLAENLMVIAEISNPKWN